LCYDDTNCKAVEEERCFGKTTRGNIGSIVKPNTETKVGTTLEAHGIKGTRAHNL
jgi:hypothetical protein